MTGSSDLRASDIFLFTRRRIEIFANAGDAWRFAASIKSVSEDAAQEYEGRAVPGAGSVRARRYRKRQPGQD